MFRILVCRVLKTIYVAHLTTRNDISTSTEMHISANAIICFGRTSRDNDVLLLGTNQTRGDSTLTTSQLQVVTMLSIASTPKEIESKLVQLYNKAKGASTGKIQCSLCPSLPRHLHANLTSRILAIRMECFTPIVLLTGTVLVLLYTLISFEFLTTNYPTCITVVAIADQV